MNLLLLWIWPFHITELIWLEKYCFVLLELNFEMQSFLACLLLFFLPLQIKALCTFTASLQCFIYEELVYSKCGALVKALVWSYNFASWFSLQSFMLQMRQRCVFSGVEIVEKVATFVSCLCLFLLCLPILCPSESGLRLQIVLLFKIKSSLGAVKWTLLGK